MPPDPLTLSCLVDVVIWFISLLVAFQYQIRLYSKPVFVFTLLLSYVFSTEETQSAPIH